MYRQVGKTAAPNGLNITARRRDHRHPAIHRQFELVDRLILPRIQAMQPPKYRMHAVFPQDPVSARRRIGKAAAILWHRAAEAGCGHIRPTPSRCPWRSARRETLLPRARLAVASPTANSGLLKTSAGSPNCCKLTNALALVTTVAAYVFSGNGTPVPAMLITGETATS